MYIDQNKFFGFIASNSKNKTNASDLISFENSINHFSPKKIALNYVQSYSDNFDNNIIEHTYTIPINFFYNQPTLSNSALDILKSIGYSQNQINQTTQKIDFQVRQLIEKLFLLESCANYGKYGLLGTSEQLKIKEYQNLVSTDITNWLSTLQKNRVMNYWNMDFYARNHAKLFQNFLNYLMSDAKFQEYLFLGYLKTLAHEPSFWDYFPHINIYYFFIVTSYILLDFSLAAALIATAFLYSFLFINEPVFIIFMITPVLVTLLTSLIISSNFSESIINWIDSNDKLFNTDLTKMFYEIDKELEALDEELATTQKKLS